MDCPLQKTWLSADIGIKTTNQKTQKLVNGSNLHFDGDFKKAALTFSGRVRRKSIVSVNYSWKVFRNY